MREDWRGCACQPKIDRNVRSFAPNWVVERVPAVNINIAVLCGVSFTLTASVAWWSWRRRGRTRAALAFALVMVGAAWWNAGHLFGSLATDLHAKIVWDALQCPAAAIAAIATLVFAGEYAGPGARAALVGLTAAVLMPTAVVTIGPILGHLRAGARLEGNPGVLIYPFRGWDFVTAVAVHQSSHRVSDQVWTPNRS
jgi:histidine kinase-like protein